MEINWLEQKDYDKAVGQFRLQLNGVLSVFAMYGMRDYIPSVVEEIVELAEMFGQRVRGKDIPISRTYARRRK